MKRLIAGRPATSATSKLAADITIVEGGGTFRATDLHEFVPMSGYAVGIVTGTWRRCDPWRVDVEDAILACQRAFPLVPYIGTWWNKADELVHVDPIIIVTCEEDARIIGAAFGQKAIFNFVTFEDITL